MNIYLIRHTQPDVERGICYGQSDIELAESFKEELQTLQSKLPGTFDKIYASPLHRCKALAETLATPELHFDERLKELDFGNWEMQWWNKLDKEALRHWMDDFVNRRCPGGESFKDLEDRLLSFWQELVIPEKDAETIALVTHGGIIRTLVCHILEAPLKNAFNMHLDYGQVTLVNKHEEHLKVMYVNR